MHQDQMVPQLGAIQPLENKWSPCYFSWKGTEISPVNFRTQKIFLVKCTKVSSKKEQATNLIHR